LKAVSLYDVGHRNAKNVALHPLSLSFDSLPKSFHDYTILHLTDLHLDAIDGIEEHIASTVRSVACDLCVMTGDYREKTSGSYRQILPRMERIIRAADAKDGILAVLGNHDTARMTDPLEQMGIRVLVNESITIRRGEEEILVSGVDDPHYYYTEAARTALETPFNGFKIGLVHTPDLYDIAAAGEYRLYLCGHTHGGQICLPGGIPIITHSYSSRKYSRGSWRFKQMVGYTNSGCSAVGIPVRFFCPSEVALIRLMRKPATDY